ncbi:hypothetical protein ACU4GD_25430 [Cupriavidus basilensis]
MERALRRAHLRVNEFLELNSIEALVELVRQQVGVTVVPLLQRALAGGRGLAHPAAGSGRRPGDAYHRHAGAARPCAPACRGGGAGGLRGIIRCPRRRWRGGAAVRRSGASGLDSAHRGKPYPAKRSWQGWRCQEGWGKHAGCG